VVAKFRKGQSDTFEHVKSAIGLANKYHIPVKLNTTVTRHNVQSLGEIARLITQEGYVVDWGWSVFQWWETRAEPHLVQEYAVSNDDFARATDEIKRDYPNLNIRVGAVENRSRKYFEIMTNGDVLNYGDGAFPGSIILGNILSESMIDLIKSPALDKKSAKFQSWFPAVGERPANRSSAQVSAGKQ
jgi:MoaA/NifB/PqqE/SkfB family radical SAM enzyme